MHRLLPSIILGVTATVQISGMASSAYAATKLPAATHTYVGPNTPMQWGPVRVTIVVQGKKISKISATAPTERVRSAIINRRALPLLAKEVLKAQSSHVHLVSGATLTSESYLRSLQAALKKAHL